MTKRKRSPRYLLESILDAYDRHSATFEWPLGESGNERLDERAAEVLVGLLAAFVGVLDDAFEKAAQSDQWREQCPECEKREEVACG